MIWEPIPNTDDPFGKETGSDSRWRIMLKQLWLLRMDQ